MAINKDDEKKILHPMDGTYSDTPEGNEYMKGGNFPDDTSKDRKYYDEGRDGDYNSQSTTDTKVADGNENYDDEEELKNRTAREGSSNKEKDEGSSYLDYNGNNDIHQPSR